MRHRPFKISRTRRYALSLAAGILLWFLVIPSAYPNSQSDGRRLSLYVYSFLLFTEWPRDAFNDTDTLNVGVFAHEALYNRLSLMMGKMIRGRKLVVKKITRVEELDATLHVLFIGSKGRLRLRSFLESLENQATLTVSDIYDFPVSGGMIRVMTDDRGGPSNQHKKSKNATPGKRFTINLDAVEKSGLKIRSRLLRISRIIRYSTKDRKGGS